MAREEDKPILLSIGYSACHWCHVMEHESFESEEIARLMNENFVSIKVDREERPDLDAIYMNFVQMTTGQGGWPLTVFLTPDQIPFYGGTYYPPEDYYGRPGFKRVLQNISEIYRTRREELEKSRDEIIDRLQQSVRLDTREGSVNEDLLEESFRNLQQNFDQHHGGFGSAPKFPSTMALAFLLRYYKRKKSAAALQMVELSLQEMGRGGIYDQLGGGFHRYSVDERWLVPHFEKMLYDNALLARLYLEAYQVTHNEYYRKIAAETLEYVKREMTDPSGSFYSAQDADSEGEEGKFFVWRPEEIDSLLSPEEATLFKEYFDVSPSGNFEGKSILHHRLDLEAYSKRSGKTPEDLKATLDQARRKLWEAREGRIKPGRDDKVLASWNGLMLSSVARAAFVLEDTTILESAARNAQFLAAEMVQSGRLLRTWKAGEARLNAYLEDYACVIEGWLDTYEVTADPRWLDQADRMMELQFELFWDKEKGDFYFTSSDHEALVVRQKEYFDNATPSGNAVSCLNLLRLSVFKGKSDYRHKAGQMLRHMGQAISHYPLGFGYWLQALDFYLGPVEEIAIVGPSQQRKQLLQPLRLSYLPNKVMAISETVDQELGAKIPLLQGKTALEGQTTAYVCRNYACQQPVTKAEDLEKQLTADR